MGPLHDIWTTAAADSTHDKKYQQKQEITDWTPEKMTLEKQVKQ